MPTVTDAYVTQERANQEMATYDALMRPKVPPELAPVYVECFLEDEGIYFTAELQPKRIFLRESCPRCKADYPEGTTVCEKDQTKLGRTAPIKGSERVYALTWHDPLPFPPHMSAEHQRIRPDGQKLRPYQEWYGEKLKELNRRFVGHRLPDSVRVANPQVAHTPSAKK